MGDYIACGAGMAPIRTTSTTLDAHRPVLKEDRIRERELFRYYRPRGLLREESSSLTPLSSPPESILLADSAPPISDGDVTLAALAQLVALRLGAHRSMINLIGRETQYTLVESTKTLDLCNQLTAENEGDESWVGAGGTMHKQQSICETLVMLPTSDGPFLIIPDLRQHPEFKSRPYVQGPPYYRFYAGIQLRTAGRGIVLGALCLFSHQPRAGLNQMQKDFLINIANTVMGHLEMKRAAAERHKVTMMSKGLNAFVEGSTRQSEAEEESKEAEDPMLNSPLSPVDNKHVPSSHIPTGQTNPGRRLRHPEKLPSLPETGSPSMPGTYPDENTPSRHETSAESEIMDSRPQVALEQQIQATMVRAAGLLSECLSLKDGSGVVFYDTVALTTSDSGSSTTSPFERPDEFGTLSDGSITPGIFDGIIDSEDALAPILAAKVSPAEALAPASSLDPAVVRPGDTITMPSTGSGFDFRGTSSTKEPYEGLPSRMLRRLLRRYPSGRLWEFDEHGTIPHDDPSSRPAAAAEREVRQRVEDSILTRLFPGVRSLVFVPLWDANLGRHYSGCFVWTTDATSRFAADVEVSFVTAFSNSISAECSRLATVDADQRKSDFIGSISHELRSPLHGILGSLYLLSETSLSSYQQALHGQIDGCTRTLLDTINHLLDYSKINSLRREWKKRGPINIETADLKGSGVESIVGSTDLAALTEEVVDSIYAGKTYAKGLSPTDIADAAGDVVRRDSESHPEVKPQLESSQVQILLDIEPGDYHFVSQPGALRRIIMNIFGNALKYTDRGSIVVKLYQTGIEGSDHPNHHHKVVVSVKDEGKGMSRSFLKTKLYTAFAQEDDLAPGAGLGLHIVKTIVTMLKGGISVFSQLGQGTEVTVSFPNMTRPKLELGPGEEEPARQTLEDFEYLAAVQGGICVGLYGLSREEHGTLAHETAEILRKYIMDYCRARCITNWDEGSRPNAIIVDEQLLPQLEQDRSVRPNDQIVVLCEIRAPACNSNSIDSRYHFLLKPVGPYKLARALRECIDERRPSASINGKLSVTNGAPLGGDKVSLNNTVNAKLAMDKYDDGGSPQKRPRLANLSTEPCGPSRTRVPKSLEPGPALVGGSGHPHTGQAGMANVAKSSSNSSIERVKATLQSAKQLPRILVVDDNLTNRAVLRQYFRRLGVPADQAEDGSKAVEAYGQDAYDIIFMDLSMPVMDGFAATKEIRRQEQQKRWRASNNAQMQDTHAVFKPVLIIAVSALASERDQKRAFEVGMDIFITKPVMMPEVGRLVENWTINGGLMASSS